MKKRVITTLSGHELFNGFTVAETSDILKARYHKPKKYFLDFIRKTRKSGFIFDYVIINNEQITFLFSENGRFKGFGISKAN